MVPVEEKDLHKYLANSLAHEKKSAEEIKIIVKKKLTSTDDELLEPPETVPKTVQLKDRVASE